MIIAEMKIIFLFFFFSLFTTACSTMPRQIEPISELDKISDQSISVVSHGWHTGIVIKGTELFSVVPELKKRFLDNEYLEIGWGDAGFYQSNKITSGLTIQAIFWPSKTVLHLVGFNKNPSEYFTHSDVISLKLSKKEYVNLVNFISASFKRDQVGRVIPTVEGIYGNSQFYEGAGRYHAFNTCNTWTAKALYSAGIDIGFMFKLTSRSVMKKLGEIEP